MLTFLDKKEANAADSLLPDCRASPGSSLDLLIWVNESIRGFDLPLHASGSDRAFYAQMSELA
jgi:hypothetical protein